MTISQKSKVKSQNHKSKLKIFSLAVVVCACLGFSKVTYAAAPCNPQMQFFVTDTAGNGISSIPQNGEVIFYLKTLPDANCGSQFIDRTLFNIIVNGNRVYIGDGQQRSGTRYASGTNEYKLRWQVSGLPGAQPGGQLQFEGAFRLNGETAYRNSSPVNVAVVSPTQGSGGGNNTPGSTAVVGEVAPPIGINNIGQLIVVIIKYMLGLVAALSVLFIIIGGVRMVASGGSESSVTAGKKTVTWAVIGLVVSLLAFTIINLLQTLLKANPPV